MKTDYTPEQTQAAKDWLRENFMVVSDNLIPMGEAVLAVLNYADRDKWISVEDRLPEDGEIVLCIGEGVRASMAMYSDTVFVRYVDSIPQDRFMTIYYHNVTHWQPLPLKP